MDQHSLDIEDSIDIINLLETENDQLRKLNEIVIKSIEEEDTLVSALNTTDDKLSFGEKVADKVALFGGSWAFIIWFAVFMLGWISFNSFEAKPYDPYPFILLNLVLSCLAALQAPIIMMSQNRKETKDRQRAENDYMVNLKAELGTRSLNKKIDLLISEQIITLIDIQKKQMAILEKLEKRFIGQAASSQNSLNASNL